jgi:hypothetical protein
MLSLRVKAFVLVGVDPFNCGVRPWHLHYEISFVVGWFRGVLSVLGNKKCLE